MLLLILGLVLFLGMHAVTMARGLRAQLIERLGAGATRGCIRPSPSSASGC